MVQRLKNTCCDLKLQIHMIKEELKGRGKREIVRKIKGQIM
jgi:hypothetical protein